MASPLHRLARSFIRDLQWRCHASPMADALHRHLLMNTQKRMGPLCINKKKGGIAAAPS